MYQSYLRRDLEKRIRKDRKMYILPLGIVATIGLVLSISTLLKSINGSVTPTTKGTNCNRTLAYKLLDFCDYSFKERLVNATVHKNCCIRGWWKNCTDKALLQTACGDDDGMKSRAHRVPYHWTFFPCWRYCDSEVDGKKMITNLHNLMTSHFGKSDDSVQGTTVGPTERTDRINAFVATTSAPIHRKLKKWNGYNWNDEIVTDNDTVEVDDNSVDNDDIFNVLFNRTDDDSDDDESASSTTAVPTLPETSSTSTVTVYLIPNRTAITLGASIDEIDILVKEEEDNVQEEDTISNETDIDTSDLIKSVRKIKSLVKNNSAYLIDVNLLLAFVNIFCYTLFILLD